MRTVSDKESRNGQSDVDLRSLAVDPVGSSPGDDEDSQVGADRGSSGGSYHYYGESAQSSGVGAFQSHIDLPLHRRLGSEYCPPNISGTHLVRSALERGR